MFFFQDVLPTPNFLYMQSQRPIFILSKPNNMNMATTGVHNHVVVSNEMKQQQTGLVLLMSRATWTNDFLNQQAMFTAMKFCAHFFNFKLGSGFILSTYSSSHFLCRRQSFSKSKHKTLVIKHSRGLRGAVNSYIFLTRFELPKIVLHLMFFNRFIQIQRQ